MHGSPRRHQGGRRTGTSPRCAARRWNDGKPSSVRPRVARAVVTIIYLAAVGCPAAAPFAGCDQKPGSCAGSLPKWRGAGGPPPVLSCTSRGFSCLPARAGSGELLPRLFTLTSTVASRGGLFSVTLSVAASLGRAAPACSTRRDALRCSDFPLASGGNRTGFPRPPAIVGRSGRELKPPPHPAQRSPVQQQRRREEDGDHRHVDHRPADHPGRRAEQRAPA